LALAASLAFYNALFEIAMLAIPSSCIPGESISGFVCGVGPSELYCPKVWFLSYEADLGFLV